MSLTALEALEWCARIGAVVVFPRGEARGWSLLIGERATIVGASEKHGARVDIHGEQMFSLCASFEAVVEQGRNFFLNKLGAVDAVALAEESMGLPTECPLCGRRMCDHTPAERGQTEAEMMGDAPVKPRGHFVSASCAGVKCGRIKDWNTSPIGACGKPAKHKVGEEILHDDPTPMRHNLTQYVCCGCYREIMGPWATGACSRDE